MRDPLSRCLASLHDKQPPRSRSALSKNQSTQFGGLCVLAAFNTLGVVAGVAIAPTAATGPTLGAAQKETGATMHAKGSFSVKLTPQTVDPILGRLTVAKELHGDLEGTTTGEMLTAMTTVKDSAGYVAIERVTGMLHGRRGTFILQHHATMDRGAQHLTIEVVPDSGTEQLSGISGSMSITIDKDGKHLYELDYTIKN
jgi:hypothetical protein